MIQLRPGDRVQRIGARPVRGGTVRSTCDPERLLRVFVRWDPPLWNEWVCVEWLELESVIDTLGRLV